MAFGCGDIRDLAKLLNVSNPDNEQSSDGDDEEEDSRTKKHTFNLGPGSVGPAKKQKGGDEKVDDAQSGSKFEVNSDDIWSQEEAEPKCRAVAYDMENDPREKPKFETYYRQAVCTEDIFLQLGNKTPGSASCENLVVVIDLPGEDPKKVNLDIKPEILFLRSPKYIFRLPLPHPVDPNGGNAKWDQDKEKLSVTLMLARELDPLNF